jgi:serpin B
MKPATRACPARPGLARRTAAVVAAGGVAAALTAGCGSRPAPQPPASRPDRGTVTAEPAASPKPYAAGDLRFGLDLLRLLCTQAPDQNVVVSPAGLASGLGLAYLGARGRTASEIASVLHLPATSVRDLLAGLQARNRSLGTLDRAGVTVATANQIWSNQGLSPLPGYLNAVATGYDAGLRQAPLLTNSVRAAGLINAAISAQTRGHIRNLVTPGLLAGVGWVLTNAVYLQASWAVPFEPGQVQAAAFATAAGARVQAHYLTGGDFATATDGGWTAVSLPYRGGRLAMQALLPPPGPGAACPVPSAGQAARLAAGLAGTGTTSAIELPEVNLRTQVKLNTELSRLGMGLAFTPASDFTGLSPQAGYLGSVVHAATLRVDPHGTVGSAATVVSVVPMSAQAPRPSIVFGRPYLLLVTDTKTGEPLFLARVANPDLP